MVEQYLETNENLQASAQAPDEMESKRESLAILASLGSTKDFLGITVKGLNPGESMLWFE